MNLNQEMSYDSAYQELKDIAREIESESISIDSLAEKVKRASELLVFCQQKLRATETEVNQIIRNLDLSEPEK